MTIDFKMYLMFGNCLCSKFLDYIQIDLEKLENIPERLPQKLLEKCAAISVKKDAITDLVDAMQGEDIRISGLCYITC